MARIGRSASAQTASGRTVLVRTRNEQDRKRIGQEEDRTGRGLSRNGPGPGQGQDKRARTPMKWYINLFE